MTNGTINRGWNLTKSSWQVLKLDKELAALPVLGLVTMFGTVLVLSAVALLGLGFVTHGPAGYHYSASRNENLIVAAVLYFVTTLIANFFNAALIYGATQRFNDQDPTIRSSLGGARRKFYPLAAFSLLMSTVGLALRSLEDRLPFAGAIAVALLGAAWSVANIFAIPVIVLSEQNVHPIDATKQSVQIIKRIWGEGVAVNLGIAIISLLSYLALFTVVIAGFILGASLHLPVITGFIFGGVAIISLFAVAIILNALGSIGTAALYHYAVSGSAPKMFDGDLLRASISPKKARKIFS